MKKGLVAPNGTDAASPSYDELVDKYRSYEKTTSGGIVRLSETLDYLDAIRLGLASHEKLSAIIPGTHSEVGIRSYLQLLSTAIAKASGIVGSASSIASTRPEPPAIAGMAAILTKFATPAPGTSTQQQVL